MARGTKSSNDTASKAPLIIGLVAFGVSPILISLPALKLVSNTDWSSSFIGWLLTPVIVFVMYGYNFYLQNRASTNPNFISRSSYGTTLKYLAYFSIVLALFHIVRLATIWSVV
jgi:hypothetical protein